ncbi:MAG: DUF4388 domain-containing protein [Candidatus Melainabacteria bacterium]|nr:DUF4388 domain-containing protein [Candidatus Melainabacteria bacterium]
MFDRKQNAFSTPTRRQLNDLWLKARKQVGHSLKLDIEQQQVSAAKLRTELSVKCYRSSTQPQWQFAIHKEVKEYTNTLISSDLSAVSFWLSKCSVDAQSGQFVSWSEGSDSKDEWEEDSLSESDDEDKSLSTISCSSLFHALSYGRATGQLHIENRLTTGSVEWVDGQIIRSRWAKLSGSEALIQMILLEEGRYSFDPDDGILRSSPVREKSIRPELSLPLNKVLLEAAYRSEQLALLLEDPELASISIKRRESLFSQERINRNLTQICGHKYIVYCLEILKSVESEEINLVNLQEKSHLPHYAFLEAITMLVKSGFVRLKNIEAEQSRLQVIEICENLEKTENLDQAIKASLKCHSAISFVLVKSLLGASSPELIDKIKSLLPEEDNIYSLDENHQLIVLQNSDTTQAAAFIRRLRTKSNKAVFLKRTFGMNCASFSFLSAAASAPEDGKDLLTILSKAYRALSVSKRLK